MMTPTAQEIKDIFDPGKYSTETALAIARSWSGCGAPVYMDVAHYFQHLCSTSRPDLDTVTRGLEIIVAAVPAHALLVVVRPVLQWCSPKLRSKFIMILVTHTQNLRWAEGLMEDNDYRVRASVVEGLWGIESPEVEKLFERATADRHHRVVANAVYGLSLRDPGKAIPQIERLTIHQRAAFRAAGSWVIRKTGSTELRQLLTPWISPTLTPAPLRR